MAENKEQISLDTRLLGDAIIEMGIARRNVSIYPKDHPVVEQSLNRAYNFLCKLFELTKEITLAVAKDTIFIDSYFLEKTNPVYKEFALCLNKVNIASVTLINGLTKEELFSFLQYIVHSMQEKDVQAGSEEYNLLHISIKYIDYAAFTILEGETDNGDDTITLWEQYISLMSEGKLLSDEAADAIYALSPEQFAELIDSTDIEKFSEKSYEKAITTYIKKSTKKTYTGRDLVRLKDFISRLRPELKEQFLASAVKHISRDMDTFEQSLRDMAVDDFIGLLSMINAQSVVIPEALKNILDKFATMSQEGFKSTYKGAGLIGDDILLSEEITSLLSDANFKEFVSEEYQKEIQKILKFDSKKNGNEWLQEHEQEWSEEQVGGIFQQTVMEILSSDIPDIIGGKDFALFTGIIKDYSQHYIDTGRYRDVLEMIQLMKSNVEKNHLHDIAVDALQYFNSEEFILLIVDSFRIVGKEREGDAAMLCEYYGENIVRPLIDTLLDEQSLTVRRFFLSMITHLGDAAIPEVAKYLEDERWYVKRNMLFILQQSNSREALQKAGPYCSHEDPRVAFEAVKCLLQAEDEQGLTALRGYLQSDSGNIVKKALSLSGSYRVRGVVPDLVQMLNTRTITGSDIEKRIPVVKALGLIGDSHAIEALRDVLSAKSFFFRKSLDKLKKEVHAILRKYPIKNTERV